MAGAFFENARGRGARLKDTSQSSTAGTGSGGVEELTSGDAASVERFVRRHIGWMLSVARRVLRDAHHAEDAVQNAFAKIFGSIDGFDGRSALKTWMHRIVVNECLMLLRKAGRAETVPIDDLLPIFDRNGCRVEDRWLTMETPESLLLRSDTRALVKSRIDLLPDDYRIILILRDLEELSTADVSDILGISEANVKVRLHRARAALKRLLEPVMKGQAE